MKVQGANSITFKGLNNPKILKTLEFIGDNNALITSGVALLAGGLIKPALTLLTPNTKKEDKEYIAAKSISSALVGFGLTNAIFQPISQSLKKIGENPENFLKKSTIKNLKNGAENLKNSGAFNFLEQSIKMSSSLLAVIPKAILTVALITPVVKRVFNKKEEKPKEPSFKGLSDRLVSKVIDSEKIQKFAIKNQSSSINQHLMNARDVLATFCFIAATKLNKKIEKKEKNPLIVNSILSTGLTVGIGLFVKRILEKPVDKFINNFKNANQGAKNIDKCVNGIKVLEPILILGSVYYLITPLLSTYLTGKILKRTDKNENK